MRIVGPDSDRCPEPVTRTCRSAEYEGLSETGFRRLLVFRVHVLGGLGHRSNDRVDVYAAVFRDFVAGDEIAGPGLDRTERAPLDARHLHEACNRVARHA